MSLVSHAERGTLAGVEAPLLIFLHAPKTGGTTMMRIIERQYPAGSVLGRYDSSDGAELANLPPDELERLRAVGGHFRFGAHDFIARDTVYVTMLRDPVARVISHYHFVRQRPEHDQYQAATALSLRDFVRSSGSAEPNNDQTRLLAGGMSDDHPTPDDMLAAARRNLRDGVAVVGLTEEFDRSLLLMRREFGWDRPFYLRENVTRGRAHRGVISAETRRMIEDFNALDRALYEEARTLFEAGLRRQDAGFQRELAQFRGLNTLYGLGQRVRRAGSVAGRITT
jgi:hypothetical protein